VREEEREVLPVEPSTMVAASEGEDEREFENFSSV